MHLSRSLTPFFTALVVLHAAPALSNLGPSSALVAIGTTPTEALPPLPATPSSQPNASTVAPSSVSRVSDRAIYAAEQEELALARALLALGFLGIGGGLVWGITRFTHHQQWQRLEFLRQAVKEFEQDPDIYNALKILDFEEYRDYRLPGENFSQSWAGQMNGQTQGPSGFRVDDGLLCNALANHDDRARTKSHLDRCKAHDSLKPEALRQYQIETALRDWFNKMLNGLEHFGYFIESGLFKEKELKPWLNYWVKLIGDPAYRRPGASKVYDALYSYIHHSGFYGVQKLFERFGYRILPSPFRDDDLLHIKLPTSGYDIRLALILAKAAYLAYQDKQFVAEIVGRWGTRLYQTKIDAQQSSLPTAQQKRDRRANLAADLMIRNHFRYFNNRGRDTQAFIFRTDEFMVLAFRGSQEPQDWTTNFTTQLRHFTIRRHGITTASSYQGRVHTGFFLAWSIIEQSVLEQLQRWREQLRKADKPLPPLYITGHSLGGALATIAAAALVENGIDVAGLYTFGQPRVGDRAFVRQLVDKTRGQVFRFVNNNDIVPHVPPPFSVWNPTRIYSHVGRATYFNARGILVGTPNDYTVAARWTNGILGFARGLLGAGFNQITDHRMEYYISHLSEALKEQTENRTAQRLERGEP